MLGLEHIYIIASIKSDIGTHTLPRHSLLSKHGFAVWAKM